VAQSRAQGVAVGGAAARAADAVDRRLLAGDAERVQVVERQRDHLCIERRILRADGLHACLVVLAEPLSLRALVTEDRTEIEELRQRLLRAQTVLDVGAERGGRSLR